MTDNLFIWKENFPPVYGNTSIAFLKKCPGFLNAKTGDMNAALTIVKTCVKQDLIIEIRQKYPNAVLLPIITDNKLPQALAVSIGLGIHNEILLCKTIDRKSLSAMERFIHFPTFTGNIKKGKDYIIVDDIVTQGGTISALRKYVISCGGTVIAIISLACSVNSRLIAPNLKDISDLIDKFNYRHLIEILRKYQIVKNLEELTKSQIKYLLKFSEIGKIEDMLERASDSLKQRGYNRLYCNQMHRKSADFFF